MLQWLSWRRERDSNPRGRDSPCGFQDRSDQPLRHPSAAVSVWHATRVLHAQALQMGGVLLQVADQTLLDDLRHGHRPKRGVQPLEVPPAGGDLVEEAAQVADVLADVVPESHLAPVSMALDGL